MTGSWALVGGAFGAYVRSRDDRPRCPSDFARARMKPGELRNDLNAEVITSAMSLGETLTAAARMVGCDPRSIYEWIEADSAFAAACEKARRIGYDVIAEQTLAIADESEHDTIVTRSGERPNSEWIQRSKLRVETRLKLLAKWHPKKYGEKLEVEQTNRNATLDIPPDMDAAEAAKRYQDFVRGTA